MYRNVPLRQMDYCCHHAPRFTSSPCTLCRIDTGYVAALLMPGVGMQTADATDWNTGNIFKPTCMSSRLASCHEKMFQGVRGPQRARTHRISLGRDWHPGASSPNSGSPCHQVSCIRAADPRERNRRSLFHDTVTLFHRNIVAEDSVTCLGTHSGLVLTENHTGGRRAWWRRAGLSVSQDSRLLRKTGVPVRISYPVLLQQKGMQRSWVVITHGLFPFYLKQQGVLKYRTKSISNV